MSLDMAEVIDITIPGQPRPQGSKRYIGGVGMVESNAAHLKPWRAAITSAARECLGPNTPPIRGAVAVRLTFSFIRPKSHYGTGRNAMVLKLNAPARSRVKPDIDKLTRAVLDALSDAGLWIDDCQVAELNVSKVYGPRAGVRIAAWQIEE